MSLMIYNSFRPFDKEYLTIDIKFAFIKRKESAVVQRMGLCRE